MKYRSRNFNLAEVCHRPTPKALEPAGLFMMGVVQCIRDRLCIELKRDIGLIVTSGYRSASVNASTPGSADNSNHTWTIDAQGEIDRVAVDLKPVGCSLEQLFHTARSMVRGEVYINYDRGIVHVAPCGPIKVPFRKKNGRYY